MVATQWCQGVSGVAWLQHGYSPVMPSGFGSGLVTLVCLAGVPPFWRVGSDFAVGPSMGILGPDKRLKKYKVNR
jgi:hypothetical protein